MNRDFIRETIKSIKDERDKVNTEYQVKLVDLNNRISYISSTFEDYFRNNFPSLPPIPFYYYGSGENLVTNYDYSGELILQGKTEVISTFKRHVEFLKLLCGDVKVRELDKQFNKYFVYFNEDYYNDTYVKNLSSEKRTTLPNIVMSIRCLSSIFGSKYKESLSICSSELDVWENNAPVKYNLNNSSEKFSLEFDNGLNGETYLNYVNNCPELDKNISKAIDKVYKDTLGIEYYKFEETNNGFIDFIQELLTLTLIEKIEDLSNVRKKEFEFGPINIIYDSDFRFNVSETKLEFQFFFNKPDETIANSNKHYMVIQIDKLEFSKEYYIKVKFSPFSQCLVFTLPDNEDKEVLFEGYTKNKNNEYEKELFNDYFTEEYKLFVLYYCKHLIFNKESFINRFKIAIVDRLKEQES